jgi:hypothetical protein
VAIGFRAKTSGNALSPNGVNFAITKPAGTLNTDLLVVVLSHGGNTMTTPTGWTAIALNIGSTSRKQSAFWAPGSVTNLTMSGTSGGYNTGWVCDGYTGVDATTPIDATGTTSTSTGAATLTANAVTIVTAQAWHAIGSKAWNAGTLTAPNFTTQDNGGASASQATYQLYNTTGKATGSTGTVTLTASGATSGQDLSAIPFALRPAAAVAGPTANPAALLMAL